MCRSTNTTVGLNNIWMCANSPVWSFTFLFSFVVASPGAALILLGMIDKKRKGTPFTPMDIFISNIIIMDEIYLVFLQPQLFINIDQGKCLYIAFVNFLHAFNLCGRPLFVTCVSLECYMAVIHPITYQARKGLTSRIVLTIANWIITVMHGFYLALTQLSISSILPVMIMITTLPIIVFCDVAILLALKKSGPAGKNTDSQKRRALHLIRNSCIITVVSYLPPIFSWSMFQHQFFMEAKFNHCVIILPSFCITTAGNAASIILYMGNVFKLNWLKSWLKRSL